MINGKRILITGGAGFIGVSLAERLAENNDLILMDNNFEANTIVFSELRNNKRVTLEQVDLLDARRVTSLVESAQVIIHLAAVIGVQKSLRTVSRTLEVNFSGTSNVLNAALANSSCEQVVFFSTSEIFGDNAMQVAENGNTFLPEIQSPRWGYSISKLAGEHLAFAYYRERGLPATVIRPFNVFGPKRVGDYALLKFVIRALADEELEVYDDGLQIRAWCYIDDFCDAVVEAIGNKAAIGQAFNIGNPHNAVTIFDLARRVVAIAGSKSKIVSKPSDFKDIYLRVPDVSKAKQVLSFMPRIELDEGLSRTIDWVRTNMDRVVPINSRIS